MYIYLKKSNEFNQAITINLTEESNPQELCGKTVFDYDSIPLINTPEDFDVLRENQTFKKFFLKATVVTSPRYQSLKLGFRERTFGTYHYGKAKASLVPGQGDKFFHFTYHLSIETNSWEGIADMKTLQERLWAGTIAPTDVYDREQRKQHPLQVLSEILSLHKLSMIKRFFLALRLTKAN